MFDVMIEAVADARALHFIDKRTSHPQEGHIARFHFFTVLRGCRGITEYPFRLFATA